MCSNPYSYNPYGPSPPLPESDYTGSYPQSGWTNPYCPAFTLPTPPSASLSGSTVTLTNTAQTVYTASQLNLKSNFLQYTIQGGGTYLEYQPYDQNYYVANLSDAAAVMSPDITYEMLTNRQFGEIFVNQTISPSWAEKTSPQWQTPVVVNAVQVSNYQGEVFVQQSSFGQSFAYIAQNMNPLGSPVYGANCGSACPIPYYYNPYSLSSDASAFTYSSSAGINLLSLFQVYEQASYLNNLALDLSQNQDVLGYNRLVYTFVDGFNNIITMPLDADLANPVSISTSVQTTADPQNQNETNVIVSGTATYSTPLGTQPMPCRLLHIPLLQHKHKLLQYRLHPGLPVWSVLRKCFAMRIRHRHISVPACQSAVDTDAAGRLREPAEFRSVRSPVHNVPHAV